MAICFGNRALSRLLIRTVTIDRTILRNGNIHFKCFQPKHMWWVLKSTVSMKRLF